MIRERTPALRYWAALAAVFLLLDAGLFRLFAFGADWAPLWVAGKLAWTDPAKVYDFDLVTSLQAPLLGHVDHRPFIYPPSALLLVAPLALLPFWLSLALLSLVAGTWLAIMGRRAGLDSRLLLISPPVVLCAMAGQPSLLVAALAGSAVFLLTRNEKTAGVLLGLAIGLKPSLFLLAPVALVASRHWRAFLFSGATCATIVALSLAAFGASAWSQWLLALPHFQQLIADEPTLITSAITPYSAALRLGIDPRAAIGASLLIAVPVVAVAFARNEDWTVRLVALLGGALLITPYAMNYELALLAPAVLSTTPTSAKRLVLPTIWAASLCSGFSLLGLAAVYGRAVSKLLRPAHSNGDEPFMKPRVHVRA